MTDENKSTKAPSAPNDQRQAAYDFCEKALASFDALSGKPKGFSISRQQVISGDSLQRTYILHFDLKLTGCELTSD